MDKQKLFEELLKKRGILAPKIAGVTGSAVSVGSVDSMGIGGPALQKRDDPGPYKLSFAQHRIWFLQQFDPASAAYNDPTALRIKGPLNIPLLEQTLNEIVSRHRVLQMNFPAQEGQPIQVFKKIEHLAIDISDLPKNPDNDVETQTHDFVNRFSRRPFNFSDTGTSLIRAGLLRIAVNDYALVVSIHHIVLDGWSKGIMLKELIALYEAFEKGKPSPLSELPIQYTDYVHWHHEWMKGHVYETQSAYWKRALAGSPSMLELPFDHPRPNIPSGKGSIHPFFIPGDKLQALNALARQENVTLFMLLMTVYNILLFRYSGQEDILIGVPIAGRHHVELESLIGLFVNTLVFRTQLSGAPSFKVLLGRVRTTALEAYAHQDMPFEKLVEELNPRRNLSVTPLFQVMFQLQNAPMPAVKISGLSIIPIQINTGFSQVDLSLTMWEEEGSMKGTFEYSIDLFEAPTIKRMAGHFQALLDALLNVFNVIDCEISHLPMLSEEESQCLLVQWNDTDSDYPRELYISQLFEICARKNPNEAAVIIENKQLTYAELHYRANRLACFLQESGVGPETLVGICMENSLALIVGVMGILKAGGAYIPMDPTYPAERLMSILKDARPLLLLALTSDLSRFNGYCGRIICLDEEGEGDYLKERKNNKESAADCLDNCRAGNAACAIYTSGSTGEPKGILIENRNIVNLVYSFIRSYHPGPGDRILPLTSIASASFVGEILPIVISGGAIFLADRVSILDIKKLIALIAQQHITILSTVPSLIARLNSEEWRPQGLRLLLSGGEALSASDIDRLIKTVTIVNGYGLTEATVCSTYTIVNEIGLDFSKWGGAPTLLTIPVGKPIINTQVYILDKYHNVVPVGVPGEMVIGGDGISRGYLNNPELTAEKFIKIKIKIKNRSYRSYRTPILFKTGDLGSWQPDGSIKFLGRIDTQVQIHGYRIELAEIETHLGLHPDIEDTVVTIIEKGGDKWLAAYLVPVNEGGGKRILPSSNQIREWLSKRMPGYMIPSVFEIVDMIPLNANGKVDIASLPIPSWDRSGLDVDFKAPQTAAEKVIASVWQEYLHMDKIGIHDNFFDLGGHSLLLTQVHNQLSEIYKNKKELTIVDMFQYPTVYALAKYIDREGSEWENQEIADANRKIRERGRMLRQDFGRQFRESKERFKRITK